MLPPFPTAGAFLLSAPPDRAMGDWDGSTVIEDHITFLRDTRRMPSAAFVKARVPPETEISPAP